MIDKLMREEKTKLSIDRKNRNIVEPVKFYSTENLYTGRGRIFSDHQSSFSDALSSLPIPP